MTRTKSTGLTPTISLTRGNRWSLTSRYLSGTELPVAIASDCNNASLLHVHHSKRIRIIKSPQNQGSGPPQKGGISTPKNGPPKPPKCGNFAEKATTCSCFLV